MIEMTPGSAEQRLKAACRGCSCCCLRRTWTHVCCCQRVLAWNLSGRLGWLRHLDRKMHPKDMELTKESAGIKKKGVLLIFSSNRIILKRYFKKRLLWRIIMEKKNWIVIDVNCVQFQLSSYFHVMISYFGWINNPLSYEEQNTAPQLYIYI